MFEWKKVFLVVLGTLWVIGLPGLAFSEWQGAESSGEKTADALIFTGECALTAITIYTDGTNDATVVLYDNTTASGKVLWASSTITGTDNYGGRNFVYPVRARNGLYLDLTGTGASAIVEYIPQ